MTNESPVSDWFELSYANYLTIPIKDKNGGELYEGDMAQAISLIYDRPIVGTIILLDNGVWVVEEEGGFQYPAHNCMGFTKLGTIHDKESRNDSK